MNIAKLDARQ
jgi:hypothetical protein